VPVLVVYQPDLAHWTLAQLVPVATSVLERYTWGGRAHEEGLAKAWAMLERLWDGDVGGE
jgi:hypothetical protein